MLPSGNDAALTLAENIGKLMRSLKRICPKKECKRDKEGDIDGKADERAAGQDVETAEVLEEARNHQAVRRVRAQKLGSGQQRAPKDEA